MKRVLVIAVVAVLALAGCNAAQTDAPEPEPKDIINGTHTKVIRMPEGFRNVAVTCLETTGIYVTSRGWVKGSVDKNVVPLPSDVAVVLDDPHCR